MSAQNVELDANKMTELDEQSLSDLFSWIDQVPLSRPKRNLNRDFSDGVMVAELIKYYFPKLVEMHNYSPANSTKQKLENWAVLNRRVFRKMRFEITEDVIKQIAACRPWVIEHVLLLLRTKIDKFLREQNGFQQNGLPTGSQETATSHSHISDQPEGDHFFSPRGSQPPVKPKGAPKSKAAPPAGGHRTPGTGTVSIGSGQNDLVPRVVLEEKEQQLLAKEETIQILQAKVRRLEHLVHLKDIRIEDLQTRIQQMRPTVTK